MNNHICNYSDLPSPAAYLYNEEDKVALGPIDIDRIIEMAWEDRTPFDAITAQFGLKESDVRKLMKRELKYSSYVLWRKRVESCKTKHTKLREEGINRFHSRMQRTISSNKISKR
jgi:uncharacterized protein (TIGR03643 family)